MKTWHNVNIRTWLAFFSLSLTNVFHETKVLEKSWESIFSIWRYFHLLKFMHYFVSTIADWPCLLGAAPGSPPNTYYVEALKGSRWNGHFHWSLHKLLLCSLLYLPDQLLGFCCKLWHVHLAMVIGEKIREFSDPTFYPF